MELQTVLNRIFFTGKIFCHSNTDNFPVMLLNGEASKTVQVPLSCSNETLDGETRLVHVSETSVSANQSISVNDADKFPS